MAHGEKQLKEQNALERKLLCLLKQLLGLERQSSGVGVNELPFSKPRCGCSGGFPSILVPFDVNHRN